MCLLMVGLWCFVIRVGLGFSSGDTFGRLMGVWGFGLVVFVLLVVVCLLSLPILRACLLRGILVRSLGIVL
jgi:hypothetical protein